MVAASLHGRPVSRLVLCAGALLTLACGREQRYVNDQLLALPDVAGVELGCADADSAGDRGVCATVVTTEGVVLRFSNLGYQSFGPVTSRVRLSAAGRFAPVVATCASQANYADIDRSGLFGHHFAPPIDGVVDAIRHRRDVVKELEFWPQCPQFWELSEEPARVYRYCAHAVDAAAVVLPPCAQSLDSAR